MIEIDGDLVFRSGRSFMTGDLRVLNRRRDSVVYVDDGVVFTGDVLVNGRILIHPGAAVFTSKTTTWWDRFCQKVFKRCE